MDEIRALAPTGMLGSGYSERSLKTAMGWSPDFIACDAGSTDLGPSYLGTGNCQFSHPAIKRDLRLMLLAARQAKVPLIVGSAGTAGGDLNLAWALNIVREIAKEEDLHFRMGVVHAEQDKAYLKTRLRQGRVRALQPAPLLNEEVIDRSAHIVGMMGPEPITAALEQGAEVVIAGRSSDTSLFAAIPIARGFPEGLVWHAAKILECGAACVAVRNAPDCMVAIIRQDSFVVEPPAPELWCTPQSVASHTLYENADPFHLYECGGMLDTSEAQYSAISDRAVRVSGSQWVPATTYTVKLEGAELAGYQSVVVGSMRDPIIIRQVHDWLARLRDRLAVRIGEAFGGLKMDVDYSVFFRIYGLNGTMGALEPVETPAHEICLFMEVTAGDQALATAIAESAHHLAAHHPVPEWHGLITGLAFPYSPGVLVRGPVYRFNMNHLVEPDDPYQMFPTDIESL